ncbi:MAG: hypothetical protein ACTHOU_03425 [Aureliella sp.]
MARYDHDDDEDERVMTLDDLFGPVPEPSEDDIQPESTTPTSEFSNATSSAVPDKTPSKSQRVRDYLDAHPDARNRDVVEALADYGVTPADVSNAKAQQKRKGDGPIKRGRPAASASPASVASLASAAAAAKSRPVAATAASGSIAMNEIEAALNFVREIGSIDRAKQLLVIIQQIQQL